MFPVVPTLKRLLVGTATRKWLLASAAAVALAAPAVSQAAPAGHDRDDRIERRDVSNVDHRDFRGNDHRDNDRHDRDGRINIDVRIGDRRPQFEERQVRVWVPPVYRTVTDRKWVEPVYRTECVQVLVPDQYQDREVRYNDHGRICTRIDHVLVVPAHYESRDQQVVVSPGHWENCDRQELVCDGHYEFRTERTRVAEVNPFSVVNPQLGGLFGGQIRR